MTANVEMAKTTYDLFKSGKVHEVINDLTAEDAVYVIPGPIGKLPGAGVYRGKAEISKWFKIEAETVDYTKFEPQQTIDHGDTVVVIGAMAGRVKANGKEFENEWVHVIRFRDGKVVLFQAYYDTAKALDALS